VLFWNPKENARKRGPRKAQPVPRKNNMLGKGDIRELREDGRLRKSGLSTDKRIGYLGRIRKERRKFHKETGSA